MMQVIREKAQGVVAWTIIVLISIAFFSWGANNYFSSDSNSTLAVVYGKKISSYQVDDIYNRWFRYISTEKGFDIKKINTTFVKQQIVRGMAQQLAVTSGLQRDGFDISDSVLVANIQQDENLQDDGRFSMERYKKYLEQLNIDEDLFEKTRRDDLLLEQVQQGIIASSFILPQEIEQVIKIRNQKRSFGYAIIPAASYKSGVSVTSAQVEEYYSKHADAFVMPEKVQLEYIKLSVKDLIPKVAVNEQTLREYYSNNSQLFNDPELFHVRHIMISASRDSDPLKLQEAKTKIDAIYSRLDKGEDFISLAKSASDDKLTSTNGGDLGWISNNDQLPPEIFVITVNNEYTPVVQSNFGWHIFQLVERKKNQAKDFKLVEETVAARYKNDAAEDLFLSAGEELANLTFENPNSLTAASDELKLPIQSTDYFTRHGGTGLAASQDVINAAFNDEVLVQRRNSDLISLSDDSYVVVKIKDVLPQHKMPLPEVRDEIIRLLEVEAVELKTKQIADELLAEINSGVEPSKAASNKNLEWKIASNIQRENKDISGNILQLAFTMAKPQSGKTLPTAEAKLSKGDHLVVTLKDVTDGKLEKSDDSNMQKDISSQIAILKGRLEYGSLQASLIKNAKIKYFELQH